MVVFNWNNFEKFGILRKDNFQGSMVRYLCKKSSFDFFVMMFSVAVCESRAIRQKTPRSVLVVPLPLVPLVFVADRCYKL